MEETGHRHYREPSDHECTGRTDCPHTQKSRTHLENEQPEAIERLDRRNDAGAEKRFIIVDAAMNDLLRPTLYEAHHAIWTLDKPGISTTKADIVGPVCETGDYLGLDRDMPDLSAGDGLVILSAGAYGAVMASTYNSRSPAAEVMVVDGTTHLLRAARPIAKFIDEEMIPKFADIPE